MKNNGTLKNERGIWKHTGCVFVYLHAVVMSLCRRDFGYIVDLILEMTALEGSRLDR